MERVAPDPYMIYAGCCIIHIKLARSSPPAK